jgi:hypothetical protein
MSFRYMDDQELYASGAYVGLALPGEAGSWQRECKVRYCLTCTFSAVVYIMSGIISTLKLLRFCSHIASPYRDTNSGVELMRMGASTYRTS